jgi:uncharacterized membrane protein
MAMRVHELHPSLVHAPLVLLPTAAALEVLAASRRRWLRGRIFGAAARQLWWGVAGSGLLAGAAGMAASQEVAVHDPRARDAMWVHGIGNVAVVLAALGLAAWRTTRRASPASAALGAGAALGALYTAWLGGELVYGHGVGVKAMAPGVETSPPLFSRQGPGRLVKDAATGLGWLLTRAGRIAARREHVRLRAMAPGGEQVSEPARPPPLEPAPLH